MILVTVGAHYQPFNRLIFLMDLLAPALGDEVVAQTGNGLYVPVKMRSFGFVPRETMLEYIRSARLIVSHAGIGTIIDAKRAGTPLVLFPRLKRHGEHNNDHQLEIAEQLLRENRPGVRVVLQEKEMEGAVRRMLNTSPGKLPGDFSGRDALVRELASYLGCL